MPTLRRFAPTVRAESHGMSITGIAPRCKIDWVTKILARYASFRSSVYNERKCDSETQLGPDAKLKV
jgi:hypothetical protein